MKRALLIANGRWEGDRDYHIQLASKVDTVVCADGGAEFACKLGLQPDRIFGDLDSLDPIVIADYQRKGTEFVVFPVEKDKTDTHLAIDYLINEGYQKIFITGALGGRPDHLLGNLVLLTYAYREGVTVILVSPTVEVQIVDKKLRIVDHQGDTFSLIPIDEVAKGVTLQGFKYPLHKHDVYRESTLGISNIILTDEAWVTIEEGLAFVFIVSQEIV